MLDIQENLTLLTQANLERDPNLRKEAIRNLTLAAQSKLNRINMPKKEFRELCLALILIDLNACIDRFNETYIKPEMFR